MKIQIELHSDNVRALSRLLHRLERLVDDYEGEVVMLDSENNPSSFGIQNTVVQRTTVVQGDKVMGNKVVYGDSRKSNAMGDTIIVGDIPAGSVGVAIGKNVNVLVETSTVVTQDVTKIKKGN